jgi:carbonic anhydrase
MLSKLPLFFAAASALDDAWDYSQHGTNWASLSITDNNCGGKAQSPINLISRADNANFNKEYKNRIVDFTRDGEEGFLSDYTNAYDANVVFNGHTVQVDLDVSVGGPQNQMISEGMAELGYQTTYNAHKFNFHAGSEHTIDGVRHDLEMHTIHNPQAAMNSLEGSAIGIMFSVEDFTAELSWSEERMIDTFFESLQLDDTTDPTVDMITFGNLMEMIDMDNRWIYKGSSTTPPCAGFVYWNVLSTIYPIKAEHLALFKTQLDRGEGGELGTRGNWREIQEIDDRKVVYVERNKNAGMFNGTMNWVIENLQKILKWMQRNY